MLRRILKMAAIMTIAGATAFTSVETAYATTGASPVIVSVHQHETAAQAKANPQVKELAAAVRAGRTAEIKAPDGRTISLRLVGHKLVVNSFSTSSTAVTTPSAAHQMHPHSWCTWAVAGAIWGLGAATLTTIIAVALLTPGVDVITIVGVTLTIGEWSAIAAVMGSFSAVYNLVAAWVC